jgi:hypothetical protein
MAALSSASQLQLTFLCLSLYALSLVGCHGFTLLQDVSFHGIF